MGGWMVMRTCRYEHFQFIWLVGYNVNEQYPSRFSSMLRMQRTARGYSFLVDGMTKNDKSGFDRALCALLDVFNRQAPSETTSKLWFSVLEKYEIKDIEQAFRRYLESEKFAPVPADIVKLIQKKDGRPEPEEAWIMAYKTYDGQPALLPVEVAKAAKEAHTLYAQGDSVGARIAFKAAYERLVNEAREAGKAIAWTVKKGADKHKTEFIAKQALEAGLITEDKIKPLLIEQKQDEKIDRDEARKRLKDIFEQAKVRKEKVKEDDHVEQRRKEKAERDNALLEEARLKFRGENENTKTEN